MLALDRQLRPAYGAPIDRDTLILTIAGWPEFRATITVCRLTDSTNMVRLLIDAPRELLVLRQEMEDTV